MEKTLIGSHNSATGEKPVGWLSRLLLPTARCQSKTVMEQLIEGVRLFDLRVTDKYLDENGKVRRMKGIPDLGNLLGHGPSVYDITLEEALRTINNGDKYVYVIVTFEGATVTDAMEYFTHKLLVLLDSLPFVKLLQVAMKKPFWVVYTDYSPLYGAYYTTDYFKYDKWYKYLLPFPRLWKRWQKYTDTGRRTFSLRDFV